VPNLYKLVAHDVGGAL